MSVLGYTPLLNGSGGNPTITLLAHTGQGAVGGSTVTTAAIDTTGATLIVVNAGNLSGTSGTLTDNKSNTWTLIRKDSSTTTVSNSLYYCSNPTVGTGHTFTYVRTGNYPSMCVAAFGGAISSPLDKQNGANSAGAGSIATGSVTPSVGREVLVCGLSLSSVSVGLSINSGFTITDNVTNLAGNHIFVAMAYLIQSGAAASNPTWSWTINGAAGTSIATFK